MLVGDKESVGTIVCLSEDEVSKGWVWMDTKETTKNSRGNVSVYLVS